MNEAEELYYLRSILGNLQELMRLAAVRMKRGEVSLLGMQALADNIDWLDCHIEKRAKEAA